MKRWICLSLTLLLLCGCGKQTIKIPDEQQSSKSAGSVNPSEAVQTKPETAGRTESEETDASGKAYDEQYFTSEAASNAETIQADGEPRETAQEDVDETQRKAILEYARCLYPDYHADNAELSNKIVDGITYLFAAVMDQDNTVFCTIAYDAQKDIYYLYDREMNQLIPIEYDKYGIRLVS